MDILDIQKLSIISKTVKRVYFLCDTVVLKTISFSVKYKYNVVLCFYNKKRKNISIKFYL